VRFLEIAGAQAGFRMNAGHAHEVQIGANSCDSFHGGSTDGDDGVFEQPA
jgi:hypothetical protein